MRISDWSSDVCSSDLVHIERADIQRHAAGAREATAVAARALVIKVQRTGLEGNGAAHHQAVGLTSHGGKAAAAIDATHAERTQSPNGAGIGADRADAGPCDGPIAIGTHLGAGEVGNRTAAVQGPIYDSLKDAVILHSSSRERVGC